MSKTIVLVHGAFAESASWNGVIPALHEKGYKVVAVANPLRSLEGDVQYLREVLSGIEGPIVLAGHSYGGMLISGAAAGNEQVQALVYIAAFAPDEGESALQLSSKFPGSTLGETLSPTPLSDGTNDLTIKQELYHQQFVGDVSDAEGALMAVTQRPIRDAALAQGAAGEPAWRTTPSWFLIPTGDKNIPAQAQRFMAERAKAREVVEIDGASHAVSASRPAEVAELILKAAE
jgi:pimeloyl-ACP methyl ester carboxylesterase